MGESIRQVVCVCVCVMECKRVCWMKSANKRRKKRVCDGKYEINKKKR